MQRDVLVLTGQTGSGKSTLARYLYTTCHRALFFGVDDDPMPSDAPEFASARELAEHLSMIDAFEDKSVPFNIFYAPRPEEYDWCSHLAMAVGYCAGFYDECDRFGKSGAMPFWWSEAITRGRRRGVAVVAVATNPILVPTEVRRQATGFLCFYQNHAADVEAFREVVGDVADEIPNLREFEVIEWRKFEGARKYLTSA